MLSHHRVLRIDWDLIEQYSGASFPVNRDGAEKKRDRLLSITQDIIKISKLRECDLRKDGEFFLPVLAFFPHVLSHRKPIRFARN